MRIYQAFVGLCVTLSLNACGSGSSSESPLPPAGNNAPAIKSAVEAIRAADSAGSLPKLNRDATVAGVDADKNGVRDDLDAYIATLPDTPAQKAALVQMAFAINNALTADTADQSALLAASKLIANAAACSHARYDTVTASKKGAEIEKLAVNTKTRFQAYNKFSAALNGTTFVLPQGDGCAN